MTDRQERIENDHLATYAVLADLDRLLDRHRAAAAPIIVERIEAAWCDSPHFLDEELLWRPPILTWPQYRRLIKDHVLIAFCYDQLRHPDRSPDSHWFAVQFLRRARLHLNWEMRGDIRDRTRRVAGVIA